jgi:hypothetical protein
MDALLTVGDELEKEIKEEKIEKDKEKYKLYHKKQKEKVLWLEAQVRRLEQANSKLQFELDDVYLRYEKDHLIWQQKLLEFEVEQQNAKTHVMELTNQLRSHHSNLVKQWFERVKQEKSFSKVVGMEWELFNTLYSDIEERLRNTSHHSDEKTQHRSSTYTDIEEVFLTLTILRQDLSLEFFATLIILSPSEVDNIIRRVLCALDSLYSEIRWPSDAEFTSDLLHRVSSFYLCSTILSKCR